MIQQECVAFIMVKDKKILIEKRKENKTVDPGQTAIPGGHCESNETLEDTLLRETYEEFGIIPMKFNYLCTLLHRSEEYLKINYFIITDWEGRIQNNEAESIFWINCGDLNKIDIETDRIAVQEYMRHFVRIVDINEVVQPCISRCPSYLAHLKRAVLPQNG